MRERRSRLVNGAASWRWTLAAWNVLAQEPLHVFFIDARRRDTRSAQPSIEVFDGLQVLLDGREWVPPCPQVLDKILEHGPELAVREAVPHARRPEIILYHLIAPFSARNGPAGAISIMQSTE